MSQIKIITNKTYTERDFQYAHYFGIENEVENGFKQCKNKHFSMGHAVLAVPAGSVSRCFVTYSKN